MPMQISKQFKFILVIILQVFIIFLVIIFQKIIFDKEAKTEVILKVEAINYKNVSGNDYLVLTYDISYLPFKDIQVEVGDTVYVLLRKTEEYWIAKEIKKHKPINKNQVFIKGKVAKNESEWFRNFIHVKYGIEDYYISKNQKQKLVFRNKNITAKVLIDKQGNAILKQIYIDNAPWL